MNIWCSYSLSLESMLVQRKWSLKEKSQRRHVLKTTVSQTVSEPVMFLQACDGVMCASELTVGWNLHVCPVSAMPTVIRRRRRLFYSDPTQQRSFCRAFVLHLSTLKCIFMSPAPSSLLFIYPGSHQMKGPSFDLGSAQHLFLFKSSFPMSLLLVCGCGSVTDAV